MPSVLHASSFFCAGTFCPVRPFWSSVGLLERPLGYYIVRSPQLDERFDPALLIRTLLALCSALQSELGITSDLDQALR